MDYTIIKINERAAHQVAKNRDLLDGSGFSFHEIDFIDGNNTEIDPFLMLKEKGFNTESWKPFDNRKSKMLPGEAGVWLSNIAVYEYIVENKIKNFLLIEDDAILAKNFVENFKFFIEELPKDYDFLSLYYFKGHNKETAETDLGLKYIHKSTNQKSGFQCVLVSLLGAKKILRHLKRFGLIYTSDCTIFHFAENGMLNGYSKKRETPRMILHDTKIKSTIGFNNDRKIDNKLYYDD